MGDIYYKHYIRVDTEGRIIKGFSNAFEQPVDGDICIDEQGGMHFKMLGIVNPNLENVKHIYIYKYTDDYISERTPGEIAADVAASPTPPPTLGELVQALTEAVSNNEFAINFQGAATVSRIEDVENDVTELQEV